MDNKQELEKFKNAVFSTAKAIARKSISLENQKQLDKITAPKIISINNHEEILEVRANADSEALRIRHSDEAIFKKNEPKGTVNKSLYKIAEKIRYEKIGSDQYIGIQNNLNNFYQKKIMDSDVHSQNFIADAFEAYLRKNMMNLEIHKSKKEDFKQWDDLFEKNISNKIKDLNLSLYDQVEYTSLMSSILQDLQIENEKNEPENIENENNEENSDNSQNQEQSLEDEQNDQSKNQEFDMENIVPEIEFDPSLSEQETMLEESDDENLPQGQRQPLKDGDPRKYSVFTNQFDKIIDAKELVTEDEIKKLRNNLDLQLSSLQNFISRLANKLQRKLLAKQNRSWSFDLEEGILDASKLPRVIMDPFNSLSYKKEKDIEFKDTVVTLLIDNSGSMRGRPISIAAICADILSRTLERCSVKVEVLGFTTLNWKGGKSRELWIKNKKTHPGRLNDLCHIIYKSADTPWRRAKNNLGLMLKEGILKENIDGEAILWAFNRLKKRKEERKIIMVISDGAPVDDSTLSVNSGNYLEQHLKKVVRWVEESNEVEINAIGIGHDVSSYYKQAIKIADVQELGDAMVDRLVALFLADRRTFN
ncbi:aerobic cobaltochelatase CobT subunit [Candidatus Pelagibacter sp. IMCC9063]|uniref:cobaltochelatase CobT-related protein n=1 Tax=Pelagibacter sp. (strain IMCC9063) TaxID=1002672 RepID=UPI0002046556|nr:cobalamin biosynthesis protein CobT [Candidatus Pelagibacter sp. IMCC9063]AEA80635.1 aerobic cobaltochelatase CobT subunit [Candidatus Pelagibacter sp. IMCC9063]